MIKTHNGIMFDNIEEELSYSFDRNDVLTYSKDSSNVYLVYYFWLKNRLLIYERIYKRIQDIISIIGGISKFVTFFSSFMNSFYHNYLILNDTKTLLFSSIEEYEKKIKKKIGIKKSFNNLNSDVDILIIRDNQQQNLKSTSARVNITKKQLNTINDNNDNDSINDNKNQNRNNKFNSYFYKNNSTDNFISQKTNTDKIYNEYQTANKLNIVKEDKNRRKENDEEIIDINMKNSHFNCLDYLYHIIKCGNTKKNIKIYNKFRAKILSEEYLVHNNLNIQILLNLNEKI
jgi:hypothetical protein